MSSQQATNVDRSRQQISNTDAVIRRPQRVITLPPSTQRPYRTAGLKGGGKTDLTAAARLDEPPPEVMRKGRSRSAFFVIAAKDADDLETPVFVAGEDASESAVALFTSQEDAQRYMHAAGWDKTHETRPIGPDLLTDWLMQARSAGVQYIAINLDPTQLKTGEPQPVLNIEEVPLAGPAEWIQEQIALVR